MATVQLCNTLSNGDFILPNRNWIEFTKGIVSKYSNYIALLSLTHTLSLSLSLFLNSVSQWTSQFMLNVFC